MTSAQIHAAHDFAHRIRHPVARAYARAYFRWMVGTQKEWPSQPRELSQERGFAIRKTLQDILWGVSDGEKYLQMYVNGEGKFAPKEQPK